MLMGSYKSLSGLMYALPLGVLMAVLPETWDGHDSIASKCHAAEAAGYAQRKKVSEIKRDINGDGIEDAVDLMEQRESGITIYRLVARKGLGGDRFGKERLIGKFPLFPPEDIKFGEDNSLIYTVVTSRKLDKDIVETRKRPYIGGLSFGKAITVDKTGRLTK